MANQKSPFSKDFAYLWPFLRRLAEHRPQDADFQHLVRQAHAACQSLERHVNDASSALDSTTIQQSDGADQRTAHEAGDTSQSEAQVRRGWTVGQLKEPPQGES